MIDYCRECGAYWDCEHKGARVIAERDDLGKLIRENPMLTPSLPDSLRERLAERAESS